VTRQSRQSWHGPGSGRDFLENFEHADNEVFIEVGYAGDNGAGKFHVKHWPEFHCLFEQFCPVCSARTGLIA